MDYTDKYYKLLDLLTEDIEVDGKMIDLKDEFEKFFVMGNKSAGIRVRKVMQMIKSLAQEVRDDVQEYKKKI